MPVMFPPPKNLRPIALNKSVKLLEYNFSGPYPFPPNVMAPFSGVYAIFASVPFLPPPHRVLYIGETSNFCDRLRTSHHAYEDWKREAMGQQLYFAYLATSLLSDEQRKDVEERLIKAYDPPCNRKLRPIFRPPTFPLRKVF